MNLSKTRIRINFISLFAIFLAIDLVVGAIFFEIAPGLRIYISFLTKMLTCLILKPKDALIFGIISDLLGVIIRPSGAFFVGYTLTSALVCLIYSIFLNKLKPTLINMILAKSIVNIVIHGFLNSYWTYLLYNKAARTYLFIVFRSLGKNIILLPLEIAAFYLLYRLVKTQIEKQSLFKIYSK